MLRRGTRAQALGRVKRFDDAPRLHLFNMQTEYKAALAAYLRGFWGLGRIAPVAGAVLLLGSTAVAQNAGWDDAQDYDDVEAVGEVIDDPELAGSSGSSDVSGGLSGGDDEVIADPELADLRTEVAEIGDLPTELRAVVHSRISRDLFRDRLTEEVWKVQHLAQLEAKLRPDERTRIAVGARLRYGLYSMEQDEPDSGALRYLLDVQPVETYYDRTLAPGAHIRIGYQDVSLGRFDAISGTDVLSVADLRDGPAALPEAVRPAQLAVRMDLTPSTSFGLELCWVPFFTPHLVQVADGDFAAFPRNRDAVNSALITAFSQLEASELERGIAAGVVQGTWRESLSRTARAESARSGLNLFAPDPNLASSQVALRARLHGQAGELAFTVATALEKVPSYRLSSATVASVRALLGEELPPLFSKLQSLNDDVTTPTVAAGDFEEPGIELSYGRFYAGSVDAALDVGAVQLGFEVSVGINRVMPVVGPLWDTARLVEYERALMGGVGVRAEYVGGDTWLAVLEANVGGALSRPSATYATGYLGLVDGQYQFSTVGLLAWNPGPMRFELGAALSTDLSYFLMPRATLDVGRGMEFELGLQVLGFVPFDKILGGKDQVLGSRFDSLDQVYLGFRWVPLF